MKTINRWLANVIVRESPYDYRITSKFLFIPIRIDEKLKWLTHVDVLQKKSLEQDSMGNTWYGWYNIAYIGDD